MNTQVPQGWRNPILMLMLLGVANMLSFQTWMTLLNNFTHNEAHFTGREIGTLQTIREIPGLLSFGVVLLLPFIKEQLLAYVALIVLAIGMFATGFFPSNAGLYMTTFIFSMGFHYFEPVKQSLSLQWLPQATAAHGLGRIISAEALGSIGAFALVYVLFSWLSLGYVATYAIAALITLALIGFVAFTHPIFPQAVVQNRTLLLRPRYWLFYVLTFFDGARRQIFVVFASFMMVEKFGYTVTQVTTLFVINQVFTTLVAPRIGKAVIQFGERTALLLEYGGLLLVFVAYAFVQDPWFAAALYLIDNMFFGLSMATSSYFRKIADPADISPSTAVSFAINHIAAVFLPITLGMLWVWSSSAVFLIGAACALCSLSLAFLIPRHPAAGNETTIGVWHGDAVRAAE